MLDTKGEQMYQRLERTPMPIELPVPWCECGHSTEDHGPEGVGFNGNHTDDCSQCDCAEFRECEDPDGEERDYDELD